MDFSRRIGVVIGVLVTAVGFYRLPRDLGEIVGEARSFVVQDPQSALVLLAGLVVLVWALWDPIRSFLGLGRSNTEWVRAIRRWTHEKRNWQLVRSGASKTGFYVVFRVGPGDLREVAVERPEGSDDVVMAMDVQVDAHDRAQLGHLSEDGLLDLRDELRIGLSGLPIEFEMRQQGALVTDIRVATMFRADALVGESEFMQLLRSVLGAFTVTVTTIGRAARYGRMVAGDH